MKETLANISFWVGLSLGLLTILDFLLREKHKKWLTDKAEILWLWLDEQKVGKFTKLILKERVQKGLVIFTHLGIILIIVSFLLRVFLNVNINASVQLGQPRIYTWQVWVDIGAMILSVVLVTKYIHPGFVKWLKFLPTVRSYLLKSLKGLGLCYLAMLILLVAEIPIIFPSMDLETADAIEKHFGGKTIVIVLHTLTSLIAAPIMSEAFLFMFMFFIGLYWIIIIYVVMIIFRVLQFLLIRIAEHPKGPVIAISGLLTGIGAVIKLFLT